MVIRRALKLKGTTSVKGYKPQVQKDMPLGVCTKIIRGETVIRVDADC